MLVARVFEAAGVPRPPEALDQFLTIYNGRLLRLTRPYPGIPEVLAEVEGRAQLAVLTNKPRDATERILAGLDLARFFSNGRVIGGDGPLPRKPDPRGLVHLVSDAGVAPDETLLVGDSAVDCRTARAAETRFCAARYGFGFQKFPVEELRQEDRLIDRPNELLSFL
jgi:phosphoglycolate phosphatase